MEYQSRGSSRLGHAIMGPEALDELTIVVSKEEFHRKG
jgi:hypothetical protein